MRNLEIMVNSGIVFERGKKTAVLPALGVRFLDSGGLGLGFLFGGALGGVSGGFFWGLFFLSFRPHGVSSSPSLWTPLTIQWTLWTQWTLSEEVPGSMLWTRGDSHT